MINLVFLSPSGRRIKVEYDVHPKSQEEGPIQIPPGATQVQVYLGTKP